jgi:uncharacterized protein YkwD
MLILIFLVSIVTGGFLFADSGPEEQLFEYVNGERTREQQEPLKWDKNLYKVALEHSKDMAVMRRVTHRGSDGSQPHERIRNARILASKTAENIAGDINIISAHTSLMKSLYHRDNILDADFSHGAVAVYEQKGYLYITELFIRKVGDYVVDEARRLIADHVNRFRKVRNLSPVVLSKPLSNIAQSHVEVQTKLGALSPLLIMSVLTRQMKSSLLVNVYTTSALADFPEEIHHSLFGNNEQIGVGFRKAQGTFCQSGCYVIALIFGSRNPPAAGL